MDQTTEEIADEFTPRERGLLIGHATALAFAEGEVSVEGIEPMDAVRFLAADPPLIPEDLRVRIMDAGMRERLDASEDPHAESAFWVGFVNGARAYLVEIQIGGGRN